MGILICAALLAMANCSVLGHVSKSLSVGSNVDGIADYSSTLAFVDVTKQSRAWGMYNAPWIANCTLDSAGVWPAQTDFGNVFVTIVGDLGDMRTPSITGNWTLSFTGRAGILPLSVMTAGTLVLDQSYDASTDTTTAILSIPPPNESSCNCIMLNFGNASSMSAGPGLRNIRLLQPGYTLQQAEDFSAPLLSLLQRFSVLRFMDWAATNGNIVADWSERSTLNNTHTFAAGNQVPWEVVFSLSNALSKDCWVNVPVNATDDYVLQLATLAKATLSPGLNLYVEYSNEVWNWGFEQCHLNNALANASVYAGDPHGFNNSILEGNGNPGYWMVYRYMWRAATISSIFASIYGSENVGRDKPVRPMYSWQEGSYQTMEESMLYLTGVMNVTSPSTTFHGLAIAPYITIGAQAESDPNLTPDEVIAGWASFAANVSIAGPYGMGGPNFIAPFAATCNYWGLACHAYESGPDTVEGTDAGVPLWAKANASVDSRIMPILVSYIQDWASLGPHMGPLNWFTAGAGPLDDKYGIYTLLQRMDVQDTPKLSAIDTAIGLGPVPISPLITKVPAVLNASFFAGHPFPAQPDGFSGWPRILNYPVQTATALAVTVGVTAASEYPGNVTLELSLGGGSMAAPDVRNVTCMHSGNWYNYTACSPLQSFLLPAGVSVIRVVRPANNPPWIGEIVVQ